MRCDRLGVVDTAERAALDEAHRLVAHATRITVLTGAGISTDSGIPDFRGPQGLWTEDPGAELAATIDAYVSDPEVRRRSWRNRAASPAWSSRPNAGHRALVDLERQGRLVAIVTQNVDGLHQAAGSSSELVIEIHGTMRETVCLRCGDRTPADATLERVRNGEEDPRCLAIRDAKACGGILKAATISFGQNLVPEDLERAQAAATTCDLLLAVGSSLVVHPAAGLVPLARARGANVVIVNAEPTPYDAMAGAVVRGSISEILPVLVTPGA